MITAGMVFSDRHAGGINYPQGGVGVIAEKLVAGLERHGGELRTRSPVAEILVTEGKASGVRLAGGEVIAARRGVIANLSPWDLPALLNHDAAPARWRRRLEATPACASFLHWHLGLRGDDLAHLPIHHVWVGDWQRGIGAERNMVVLSMPSLLDPSLAPAGHHVLHGYTPANEPWEIWKDLEPGTAAYVQRKQEGCQHVISKFRRLEVAAAQGHQDKRNDPDRNKLTRFDAQVERKQRPEKTVRLDLEIKEGACESGAMSQSEQDGDRRRDTSAIKSPGERHATGKQREPHKDKDRKLDQTQSLTREAEQQDRHRTSKPQHGWQPPDARKRIAGGPGNREPDQRLDRRHVRPQDANRNKRECDRVTDGKAGH
jgi:hypothetical protein